MAEMITIAATTTKAMSITIFTISYMSDYLPSAFMCFSFLKTNSLCCRFSSILNQSCPFINKNLHKLPLFRKVSFPQPLSGKFPSIVDMHIQKTPDTHCRNSFVRCCFPSPAPDSACSRPGTVQTTYRNGSPHESAPTT